MSEPSSAFAPVSMSRYASDFDGFAQDLGASWQRYGFAVVSDHGLNQAVIDRALADAKAFFALPAEVKRAYHEPGTGGARGYTPFGTEAAKDADVVDLKEFWHTGRELPEGHPYRGDIEERAIEDGGHAGEPELPERPIQFDEIHCVSPVRSMRSR